MALMPVYATSVLHLGSGGLGFLLGGFGVGAVIAAGLLPKIRERVGEDAVVTIGTLGVAAALLGLAVTRSVPLALAIVVVAGAAWLLCLSTFNVASQEALPGWVRARGLAMYLTVFMGGVAIGSAAWGYLAELDRDPGYLRVGGARRCAHHIVGAQLAAACDRRGRPEPFTHARAGDAARARGGKWAGVRDDHLRSPAPVGGGLPGGPATRGPGAPAHRGRAMVPLPRRRPASTVHRDLRCAELERARASARAAHRGRREPAAGPPGLSPRRH